MPSGAHPPAESLRPPVPVQVAFWIWIASAVLVLVRAVLVFGQKNEIISELRTQKPAGLSPSEYPQAAQTLIEVQVAVFVLAALFYVFFAYKVRGGRNWARLTITVLTVIGVIYSAYTGLNWNVILSLLISVVAVVLVYLRPSADYFAAYKRAK